MIEQIDWNEWNVNRKEDGLTFIERKNTGKKVCLIEKRLADEIGNIEIARIWVKDETHPIIVSDRFYDFLSSEFINCI